MQWADARVDIAGRGCWPSWSPGCEAGEDHGEADEAQRRDRRAQPVQVGLPSVIG